jgi:hypothetical protein
MSKRLKDLTAVTTPAGTDQLVLVTPTETNLLSVDDLKASILTPASTSDLGAIKVGANLTVALDGTLNAAAPNLPTQTNNNGKFLTTNGTALSWATMPVPETLPSHIGASGKYLKSNGISASWEFVANPQPLPVQTNNGGKFLTTNGSALQWTSAISLEALKTIAAESTSWEDFKAAIAAL